LVEYYSKGENLELESLPVVPGCSDQTLQVKVTPGTKIRNVISETLRKFQNENQLLFVGSGAATGKVITCAEVVKKRLKKLHQITILGYKKVEEYWEPKTEGLDRLKVVREIPTIFILLSKQPLDATVPGYQPPNSSGDEFWKSKPRAKGRKSIKQKSN
ncbi:unnamed protein product, partial [Meganyctiphanes norvegica]